MVHRKNESGSSFACASIIHNNGLLIFCKQNMSHVVMHLEFVPEALSNCGINIKGTILADPGKELLSSDDCEAFAQDRPHSKQWY